MAQESKREDDREVDEDEPSEEAGSAETLRVADDDALTTQAGGRPRAPSDESDEAGEGEDQEAGEGEEGEPVAAAHLGADRYVLAGFFAAAMLSAYIIGRAVQGLWINVANKDWFSQHLPRLAAVSDDDKAMYGVVLGGIISLVVAYRSYNNREVRTWADEVAAELAKVVWPSRKEVYNSTFVVIVASAVATIYLALLDRLWAFVTNIVYGDGS